MKLHKPTMSEALVQNRRRSVDAIAVAAFALALLTVPTGAQTRSIDDDHTVIYSQRSTNTRTATRWDEILPFRVNVPDDALVDLRKRVLATRWPEKETVSDRSQGVQLAKLQELVRYWIGQALTDSPAGLAAFMYDYNDGEPERLLTRDDFLDNVTLYWLTNTATSAARLYWETGGQSILLAAAQKTSEITLPVAITVFPEEVYRAPETWARRAYRNLIYFKEVDKGGHFAAWEQPELLAAELRAAFRSLRSAN